MEFKGLTVVFIPSTGEWVQLIAEDFILWFAADGMPRPIRFNLNFS